MSSREKYYLKTFGIFFTLFIIITIIAVIINNNINLAFCLVTPLLIFVYYRQYYFIKSTYNYTSNKLNILLLIFSITAILFCFIYTQNINKIFNFISYLYLCTSMSLSSIFFNNIENKLKEQINYS